MCIRDSLATPAPLSRAARGAVSMPTRSLHGVAREPAARAASRSGDTPRRTRRMAAHDQQGCHRVSYQVRRNASEGNVRMATAALRGEDNEVYRLVDDSAREAAVDVAVAQHEASGGDSALHDAGADPIKVIVCNALIAPHELPSQLQIPGLERPDFREFRHRNHMGEEKFCALGLRKTQCERK